MKVNAKFHGENVQAAFDAEVQRIELKVLRGLKRGVEAVKRHLVAMTETRLVRRSGALLRDVKAAKVIINGKGSQFSGELHVIGLSANTRGQKVRQYLNTHFGKGKKTITSKGKLLAIPIKGGPAAPFGRSFGTNAISSPKDMKGIMVRIGQVLYAGSGKSRDLYPAFVLRPYVVIPRRIDPQDAVDEAQMEILENFRGLVGSVNR